jgi:uroporphyrinogen decarboxylase
MAPQTLHENVERALHFEQSEALPYSLPMDEPVIERLNAYYGGLEWQSRLHNAIGWISVPKLGLGKGLPGKESDVFGAVWRTDQRPAHLVRPALDQPDLNGYRWPTLDEIWDEAAVKAQVEAARGRGQFVVASTGLGLFERSWTLRGFENALTDMLLYPQFYHALLDGILAIHLQVIERLAALGVDGILLSDDWGEQRGVIMGPRLWRTFIRPRATAYFAAVHAAGKWTFQHCCGNVYEIIPEMIECGLDVLESLQPEAMDVYAIKRNYGKDLRLWGGLGTQQMIPFGTPQQIRQEVRRLRQELGAGGGYILAPAKPLLPEVPTENAVAVLEAFAA